MSGVGVGIKATGGADREGAWLLGLGSTSAIGCAEWGRAFARLSGVDGLVDVLGLLTGLW